MRLAPTLLASTLLAPALLSLAIAGPASAGPRDETRHVVEDGETLNGIANRAGVTARAIAEANHLGEPYLLRVGETLVIPRKAPAAGAAAPRPAAGSARKSGSGEARAAARAVAPVIAEVAPPGQQNVHVVQPGETLGSIAVAEKVPRVLIAEANGLADRDLVKAGQTLVIPRTGHYTVRKGDTGFGIAMDLAVPWEMIALANGIEPGAPLRAGQELLIPTMIDEPDAAAAASAPVEPPPARFAWPLPGEVRRGFKAGGGHDGIDIPAARGAPVRAAAAGTVIFAGREKDQFGNLVVVDHGGGWNTAYGFLSRITVRKGARVAAGERVGLVGDTGLAKGDELHFEVRRDNRPVDPLGELPPR